MKYNSIIEPTTPHCFGTDTTRSLPPPQGQWFLPHDAAGVVEGFSDGRGVTRGEQCPL
jgi:hypothetical protein